MERVVQKIAAASRVMVLAHEDPDGDALGSVLGLVHMLRAQGKQAWGYRQGLLPDEYRFLPGMDEMLTELPPPEADLVVLLDCHQPHRAGKAAEAYLLAGPPCVIVDHHEGAVEFGEAAWINPGYAATAELLTTLADSAGFEITPEAATCLYVGLLTDTGSFGHGNTNARVFRCAARLVEAGAVPWQINSQVYATFAKRQIILCRTLQSAEYLLDGKLVLAKVTLADLEDLDCQPYDLENLVEKLRAIPGVLVSVMAKERKGGKVKISLRSVGDIDVAGIALDLGGGGHKNAAGAKIDMSLDDCVELLKTRLAGLLENV